MHNLAQRVEADHPSLLYATVLDAESFSATFQTPYGVLRASLAAGCLVSPGRGDLVLASVCPSMEAFALSALAKASDSHAGNEVSFTGPTVLRVLGGGLAVVSDHLHAHTGLARVGRLSYAGRFLTVQVQRVKAVAVFVDSVCRRLVHRLGNSFKYVKEHGETQSNSSRALVEDTMTLHSKNTAMMSEERVVANAEQIHLG